MDRLSIFGALLALIAILGGQYIEGGSISTLVDGPAALIVFGGTIGAVMLQSSSDTFFLAMRISKWVFIPPKSPLMPGLRKIINWSIIARKEGLLGLEEAADTEDDPFARKALNLLVDGGEPEIIRSSLTVDFHTRENKHIHAARVFEAMGGYAPTIGIVGAVMGLIQVMSNLSDPGKLGPGIATAFVATIYGVTSANLIFLPIANKVKSLVLDHSHYEEMIIEGIVAISEGENPRMIESKLTGFAAGK
ncbi:MAG: flagellar motor protein [Gammaproteobacteria bacterium]|nr:flagellar motor protein [Gammaproteobacteria bacterium]